MWAFSECIHGIVSGFTEWAAWSETEKVEREWAKTWAESAKELVVRQWLRGSIHWPDSWRVDGGGGGGGGGRGRGGWGWGGRCAL